MCFNVCSQNRKKECLMNQKTYCGANCAECPTSENCKGCLETKGCPFGKQCFVANYVQISGEENFLAFKKRIIEEINALNVNGMEKVNDLYPLVGKYVNLEYSLPNGEKVKFLNDDEVYLGVQVKNLFDDDGKTCYGVVARESFILVCEYDENCVNSEIVIYKRR